MADYLEPRMIRLAKGMTVGAYLAGMLLALEFLRLLGLLNVLPPMVDRDWRGVGDALFDMAPRFIDLIPTLCYLTGVAAAARLFERVSKGELFSEANAKGLADMGSALLWGSIAAMIIVPWLHGWIEGDYGLRGVHLGSETSVVFVIGGAILVLGHMMRKARRLQGELDEII